MAEEVRRRDARGERRADLVAGIPGAISSVPDGMAAAILVGINPVHGLYASFAGPIAGGLTTSTRMMVITTTTAAALAAGSGLAGVAPADRADAVVLLTAIAGAAMVLASVLRLGRYTRFVSQSVMIGFLTGVAINILLGQLPQLTGAPADGSSSLAKALHVVTNPRQIDVATLFTGLLAAVLMLALMRSRWSLWAALAAVTVPTAVVSLAGGLDVAVVSDLGAIPPGVPTPHLPDPRLISPGLVAGALAVAAIVLVQGAGVSEAAPNPDGRPSDANRDFVAQGLGNLAAALFRGQPVGGSVGQTALNVAAGARTRWAAVCSGVWMLLILVALAGVVGHVAMTTLAAVLMVAAATSLRIAEVRTIWHTGLISQLAVATTFTATLFLSVPAAVGIGVVLSLLLQLNQEAMDLAVVELVPDREGRLVEQRLPPELPDGRVTVIDVYGSLFYAGSRTLQARLPDPARSRRPVVVLRLRGRTTLGATFFAVIADYAERLARVDGKLYLSGVDPAVLTRMQHLKSRGPVDVLAATPVLGESTLAAVLDGETWLVRKSPVEPEGSGR